MRTFAISKSAGGFRVGGPCAWHFLRHAGRGAGRGKKTRRRGAPARGMGHRAWEAYATMFCRSPPSGPAAPTNCRPRAYAYGRCAFARTPTRAPYFGPHKISVRGDGKLRLRPAPHVGEGMSFSATGQRFFFLALLRRDGGCQLPPSPKTSTSPSGRQVEVGTDARRIFRVDGIPIGCCKKRKKAHLGPHWCRSSTTKPR